MEDRWFPDEEASPRRVISEVKARFFCFGQLASIAFAVLRVISSQSTKLGVDLPITLSFFSYLTITCVYGSLLVYRRQKLHIRWCWYLLLAFVDVQGHYLVNKVFQLSSLTSVAVLDSWMAVLVVLLTWRFLGKTYIDWHFIWMAGCFSGLYFWTLSGVADRGDLIHVLRDVLVIAGAIFFVLSNVGEEFCIKNGGLIEVLTMLGLFGMFVSLIEMAIFEKKNLESVSWSSELILTFVGYAVAGFTLYSLTALVLQACGATLVILSLFTTHLWEVVIRAIFYHQNVDSFYYLSFLLLLMHLRMYFVSQGWNVVDDNEETDEPYQLLIEEEVA